MITLGTLSFKQKLPQQIALTAMFVILSVHPPNPSIRRPTHPPTHASILLGLWIQFLGNKDVKTRQDDVKHFVDVYTLFDVTLFDVEQLFGEGVYSLVRVN